MKQVLSILLPLVIAAPSLSYAFNVTQDEGEVHVEFDASIQQDYEYSIKEAPGAETKVETTPNGITVKHLKSQESGSALYLKLKPGVAANINLAAGKLSFTNLSKNLDNYKKVFVESEVGTVSGAKLSGLSFKRSLVGASSWYSGKGLVELQAKVQAGLVEIE